MKRNIIPIQIGDKKVLSREVTNLSVTFDVGDTVEVIGIGERGYDLKEVTSGESILECGWDLFK